jgi:hypothetical protein
LISLKYRSLATIKFTDQSAHIGSSNYIKGTSSTPNMRVFVQRRTFLGTKPGYLSQRHRARRTCIFILVPLIEHRRVPAHYRLGQAVCSRRSTRITWLGFLPNKYHTSIFPFPFTNISPLASHKKSSLRSS